MSMPNADPSSARLCVVDADAPRRLELCALLRDAGYGQVSESADPRAAVSTHGETPDLALVDLDTTLPADVEPLLAERHVPVIGVTSDTSAAGRRRAASAGVADFLGRPIEPSELRMRVDNALANARLRRLLSDPSGSRLQSPRVDSSESGTVRESLSLLAAVADFHDDDSDQHAHRVGALSGAIARALELPEEFVTMLIQAAPLHDIGKVGVSRRILLKPGKLTPPEWMHMMQHVDIGGQILAPAHSSVLRLAGEIARTHHERWDGSGYTSGLAGQDIPISGRIVAVADVWDTLTHDRPYRKAWEPERALAEIRAQAGAHFDPGVVEAFCGLDLLALMRADGASRLAA
jgi:response regulator RpfG family c-di-GMP phosphodiesterase